MPIEDCINVTGLALDIVGIALLFWVAPEKDPDPQSRAGFAIPREHAKLGGNRKCVEELTQEPA